MPRYYYARHDSSVRLQSRGVFWVDKKDTQRLNSEGYGIFQSVQSFKNCVRRNDNIEKLLAFAIDLDDGTKDQQLARLCEVGITPSSVIESKRGFHVYFNLRGETFENRYAKFMSDYIVPLFNADNAAKDLARILRAPNFFHCKDLEDKYLCKTIFRGNVSYEQKSFEKLVIELANKFKHKYNLFLPEDRKKIERKFIKKCSSTNMTAEQLAYAIGNPIKCGSGWRVKCVCHEEKEPSLHIQTGDKVPIIWNCFGGCNWYDILTKFEERGLW